MTVKACALASLSLVIFVMTAQAAGSSIVPNGGFESFVNDQRVKYAVNGAAEGWSGISSYVIRTGYLPVDNAHSGDQFLVTENTGNYSSHSFVRRYVPTSASTTYRLTFWVGCQPGNPAPYGRVLFGNSGKIIEERFQTSEAWVQKTYEYTAIGNSMLIELRQEAGDGAGYAKWDDVCLEIAPVTTTLNVRDFGAKGDGVTDDTAALIAVNARLHQMVNAYQNETYIASFPEVVFPSGTYVISDRINWGNYANIRGIGNVTIRQINPQKDAFFFEGYRICLDNIDFDGGFRHIKIFTSNVDTCFLTVRNCRFSNSGSYAIESYNRRTEDGQYLDEPGVPNWYNSTLLHIAGCEFNRCYKVLYTSCDLCVLEDSIIETHPDMTGAAIASGPILKLENINGLANVTPGKGQRWIGGGGSPIVVRNVNLRSSLSAGIPVVDISQPMPGQWDLKTSVVLSDSKFAAAGSPENCIIYCQELTNLINVYGCREISGTPVPILGFDEVPAASYFDKAGDAVNLAYSVSSNDASLIANLPASMQTYQRTPLPQETDSLIRARLATNKEEFLSRAIRSADQTINASTFGAVGNGTTDNKGALQSLFDSVDSNVNTTVEFPAGIYKVGGRVTLPRNVSIRSMGRAIFEAADGSAAEFAAEDAGYIAFHNVGFDSMGVRISTKEQNAPAFLFENCIFTNTPSAAVDVTTDVSTYDQPPVAKLRVTDCVFVYNKQVLRSNVNALVDSCWITTFKVEDSTTPGGFAAIENHGYLRFENILGCPATQAHYKDTRWIDNSGKLICDVVRMGGEYGGIPAVNSVSDSAGFENQVIVQNSWLYANPDSSRKAHIYCEESPSLIVLRNNVGVPYTYPTVVYEKPIPYDPLGRMLRMSTNALPETFSAPPITGLNLIANGGFEIPESDARLKNMADSPSTGWTGVSSYLMRAGFLGVDVPHSGSQFAVTEQPSGGTPSQVTQWVAVNPGTTYRLTFWVGCQPDNPVPRGHILFGCPGNAIEDSFQISTTWAQKSYLYTPTCSSVVIQFRQENSDGPGYAKWDDASLQEATSPLEVTVGGAKAQENGTRVSVSGTVTSVFGKDFYIESVDRASGIRVEGFSATLGNSVQVVGDMDTLSSGERFISADSVDQFGGIAVAALGMSNGTLGGGGLLLQTGVTDGSGLNNIGLLIRTTGRVTEKDTSASPVCNDVQNELGR